MKRTKKKKKIKSASATPVAVAVPLAPGTLVAAKLTPSCLPCSLPIHIFFPSFFCFCAAYKRFLPVVVFVSPHFFFRFFFLCIFVFICKISSLISVRVRLGPACVCVCGCLGCVLCHWNATKHLSCPSCSQSLCLLLLLTEGDWLPLHINITLLARSAHCNLFRLTRATMAAPAPAPTSASALVESFVSCERSV